METSNNPVKQITNNFIVASNVILLILLIIFLVANVVEVYRPTFAFRVKPTEKLSYDLEQISNDFETLVISIDEQKQVRLNRSTLTKDELKIKLGRLIEERTIERKLVYLRASEKLTYEKVMEVIDIIKASGATSIYILE
jgi:biopolymer transport protein ExbD